MACTRTYLAEVYNKAYTGLKNMNGEEPDKNGNQLRDGDGEDGEMTHTLLDGQLLGRVMQLCAHADSPSRDSVAVAWSWSPVCGRVCVCVGDVFGWWLG